MRGMNLPTAHATLFKAADVNAMTAANLAQISAFDQALTEALMAGETLQQFHARLRAMPPSPTGQHHE